jgi:hypothetical protein
MTTPRTGFRCWWDPLPGACKGYMRRCAPAPASALLQCQSAGACAPAPSCLLTSSPSLLLQLQQAVAPTRPAMHALIPEPEQFSFCPFFSTFLFYFVLHFPSNLSTPAPF